MYTFIWIFFQNFIRLNSTFYKFFFFIYFIFLPAASRIRYEITSGNIGGAFAVKNMTGAIYVAGALDYETRRRVSWIKFLKLQKFYI